MITELDSLRQYRPAADLFQPVITAAQEADNELVLLAKIATLLNTLQAARLRSGVVLDAGGLPRAVIRAWEDVTANETYEELVANTEGNGLRIKILGLFALGGATGTTLTLYSKIGAGAAVQCGPTFANGANGGELLPYCEHGWLQDLPAGAALGCSTSNHSATGVIVIYILVPNYLTDENGLVLFDEAGIPLTAE